MAERFEYNSNTSGDLAYIYAPTQHAQTFTPQTAHTITSVKLYLWRYGPSTPWTLYADIYQADAEHKPTGEILCSGSKPATEVSTTPTWHELTLGDGAWLTQDQEYVIVIRATDASAPNFPRSRYQPTDNPYPRGLGLESDDAGATWTVYANRDYPFEDWGTALPPAPSIETLDASNIKSDQADLKTKVIDDKEKTLSVRHNYGKTTAYGMNTPWQEGKHTNDIITQTVTNLDPETGYHFRGEAVYED